MSARKEFEQMMLEIRYKDVRKIRYAIRLNPEPKDLDISTKMRA